MNGCLFYGYYSKVWTDSTDLSALMNVIEIFVCIQLNMIHIHRTSTWALSAPGNCTGIVVAKCGPSVIILTASQALGRLIA